MGTRFQTIPLKDFREGLSTDADSADQPIGSASSVVNLTFESSGFAKKTRGPKVAELNSTTVPNLPSGFVPERGIIYRVYQPSQQDVIVLFGAEDSRDRLYAWPFSTRNDSDTWDTSDWAELTEIVSTKVDTVTSSTVFTLDAASDLVESAFYYNSWLIQVWDRSTGLLAGWDYVSSYTNSPSRQVTVRHGFPQIATDDDVVLCRFPIFKSMSSTVGAGNYDVSTLVHYQFDSTPNFQVFGGDLYIYTGSEHDIGTAPDLWLGYISQTGTDSWFGIGGGSNSVTFSGYFLQHAQPKRIQQLSTPTLAMNNATGFTVNTGKTNGLPYESGINDSIIWQVVGLYDGFQESNIAADIDDPTEFFPYNCYTKLSGTDTSVSVVIELNPLSTPLSVNEWGSASNAAPVMSNRVEKIVLYAGVGLETTSGAKAILKPLVLNRVWEAADDSSNWTEVTPSAWVASTAYSKGDFVIPSSGNETGFAYICTVAGTSDTAPNEPTWTPTIGDTFVDNTATWMCVHRSPFYRYSIEITGDIYDNAILKELTSSRGYGFQKIGANADFATRVGGNYAVGPFYADQEYRDAFVVVPFTGTFGGGRVTPAVLPVNIGKFSFFLREYGIEKIINHTDLKGRHIIFGDNSFVVATLDGEASYFSEHPSQRGLVSKYGFQTIDNILYFCSHESIYAFDGQNVVDIGERIRTSWRDDISDATKSSAIMGYNIRKKLLLIQAGTTLFSYDTLRNTWATETIDHSTDTSWIQFMNTPDNKLFVIATDKLWELDASSFTTARSTIWKSNAIASEEELDIRRFYGAYQSDDTVTVNFYDGNLSTTQPVKTLYLPANSKQEDFEIPVTFRAERVFIEATTPSSTNETLKIGKLAIGVLPKAKE